MAMDHGQHGRRGGHFHNRGRRGGGGGDRRGRERPPAAPAEQAPRTDRVDVEQIMREIRARISQRSGLDLSNQQIQELAARRLEAILDPRSLKPALLDELRRGAGEAPQAPEPAAAAPPLFEEVLLYDSPNGFLRFLRKLFNPILRLLFNPTPIAHALAVQGRMHAEAAARAAEQGRRQSEWNALHYEILQRLVREIARGSLEAESLAHRVESLDAKVDYSDRRVATLEGGQMRSSRPAENHSVSSATPPSPVATASPEDAVAGPSTPGQPISSGDAPRRRRRRRRGRRGAGAPTGVPTEGAALPLASDIGETDVDESSDQDAGDEPDIEEVPVAAESSTAPEAVAMAEPPAPPEPAREPTPGTSEE